MYVGDRGRWTDGESRIKGGESGGPIVLVHADRQSPQRKGPVRHPDRARWRTRHGELRPSDAPPSDRRAEISEWWHSAAKRVGQRVVGIKGERAFQQRQRSRRGVRHRRDRRRGRAQHEIVGVEVVRPLALDALDLGLAQARLDRADDAQRDLVLQREDVVEPPVVALGPEVRAGLGLDQLRR